MTVRVLIVDDHPIVLQGCRLILRDLAVREVHEASTLVSGYRSFLRLRPDVLVVDLSLGAAELGGVDLIRRITARHAESKILAFSMHNDPVVISRALSNGALGYVAKDSGAQEFTEAFTSVAAGRPYLAHELAISVAMLQARGNQSGVAGLTDREGQILALIARSHSYDEVATKLNISYKTVVNAAALMRTKLKLSSLAELIHVAREQYPRPPGGPQTLS